jgi:hypothetical protein
MRQYKYESLLEQLLLYLNQPVATKHEDELKKLPWVVERLLLWLFRDRSQSYGRKIASEQDVKVLASLAWQNADRSIAEEGIGNLDLFMRQHWMNQVAYQSEMGAYNLCLQMHLLSKLDKQTRLHKFFTEQACMPLEIYFELAMLRWSHTKDQPWVNQKYIDSLQPAYAADIQHIFLSSMTRSLNEAQSISKEKTISVEEWSQPFYFYKTPCVWHAGASIPLGRPNLRRHFEGILFDWIEQSGDLQVRQHFDEQIENFVGYMLRSNGLKPWSEDKIRDELRPDNKKAVDFMVLDEVHAILIEVKNKSLTHAVPASKNAHPIKSRLKGTVVKAIEQLDSTEGAILSNPDLCNRAIIRLIVTFNDLWISSAESLLDEARTDKSWLISIQDLSYLLQVAEAKQLSVGQILNQFVEKQADRVTSSLTLGRYLDSEFQVGQALPIFLRDHGDATLAVISEKLKHLK